MSLAVAAEEIRRLLRMARDGRVTMAVVNGYDEVPDFRRDYWVARPPTDVHLVLGVRDRPGQLVARPGEHENQVEITFPNENVETMVS